MSQEPLSTQLLIEAQRRRAGMHGIPFYILHKGDPKSGAILLKINTLDGKSQIYSQIRLDEDLVWSPVATGGAMSETEADAYMREQSSFDPDLWLVEIEDKEGRLWFEGRVLEE